MFFPSSGKHRRGKIRTDVFKTEILPNTNLAVGRDQITGPTPPFLSKCKEKLQGATLLQLWTLLPRNDTTPDDQQNPKSPLSPAAPPLCFVLSKLFFFFNTVVALITWNGLLTENTFLVWNDSIFKDDSTCSQTFKKPLKPFSNDWSVAKECTSMLSPFGLLFRGAGGEAI